MALRCIMFDSIVFFVQVFFQVVVVCCVFLFISRLQLRGGRRWSRQCLADGFDHLPGSTTFGQSQRTWDAKNISKRKLQKTSLMIFDAFWGYFFMSLSIVVVFGHESHGKNKNKLVTGDMFNILFTLIKLNIVFIILIDLTWCCRIAFFSILINYHIIFYYTKFVQPLLKNMHLRDVGMIHEPHWTAWHNS